MITHAPLGLFLLLATFVVGFNWTVVWAEIRKRIRKTDERVPSGIYLVTAILVCLTVSASVRLAPSNSIIFWWGITLLVLDPFNWMLLYLPVLFLKEKFQTGKNNE